MKKISHKASQLAANTQKAQVNKVEEVAENQDTTTEKTEVEEVAEVKKLNVKVNPEGTFEKNKANMKAVILPSNRGSIVTDAKDLSKIAAIKIESEKKRVALIAAHEANLQASQELENVRINDFFNVILEKHEIEAAWVTIVAPDLSVINYLIPEKPKG